MKYLPAVAVTLGVSVAILFALFITKNPQCLWGFGFLLVLPSVMPKEERAAKKKL